jgi:hypothetical protein
MEVALEVDHCDFGVGCFGEIVQFGGTEMKGGEGCEIDWVAILTLVCMYASAVLYFVAVLGECTGGLVHVRGMQVLWCNRTSQRPDVFRHVRAVQEAIPLARAGQAG